MDDGWTGIDDSNGCVLASPDEAQKRHDGLGVAVTPQDGMMRGRLPCCATNAGWISWRGRRIAQKADVFLLRTSPLPHLGQVPKRADLRWNAGGKALGEDNTRDTSRC